MEDDLPRASVVRSDVCFRVATYNVLAESWHRGKPVLRRKERILQEVIEAEADVICLQESEPATFDFLMQKGGFDGFSARFGVGCDVLAKPSIFRMRHCECLCFTSLGRQLGGVYAALQNVSHHDHAVICFLEHIDSGRRVCVVNAHLYFEVGKGAAPLTHLYFMQFLQVQLLLQRLVQLNLTSVVFCGDLNSNNDQFASRFLRGESFDVEWSWGQQSYRLGTTDAGNTRWYQHVCNGHIVGEWPVQPNVMQDAYFGKMELPTFKSKSFEGVLDHIYFRLDSSLQLVNVRPLPVLLDAIPNDDHPSDHLMLFADFKFLESMSQSEVPCTDVLHGTQDTQK